MIIKQLGLENDKGLSTPAIPEEVKNETKPLNAEYASQFKSIIARANYLSPDRPDIQYAVRSLAIQMSSPRECDWNALKRLGRYLV